MVRYHKTCTLVALLFCTPLRGVGGDDKPGSLDPDEQLAREARVRTDGAGLLGYLRQRSVAADGEQPERVVRGLGEDRFEKREEASRRLIAAGLAALPALRKVAADSDQEVARRAKGCIEAILREWKSGVAKAVVRLVVRKHPPGSLEALLRYLPAVGYDPELEEEVWFALDALAASDPGGAAALTSALTDGTAVRRAAAACILGRRRDERQRAAVQRLLSDPDPVVRLRAAQGLLAPNGFSGPNA